MSAHARAEAFWLDPKTCREDDANLGGKGRNLVRLARNGLPVPRFACVSAAAHARLAERIRGPLEHALDGLDYASNACVEAAARGLERAVLETELPPELDALLGEVLPEALRGDRLYAVRSSATEEDSATASYAGQLESFLCVARGDVADRVRRCWASAYGPRLLHYLHALGRDPLATRVAVVVQEMVASEASGVLFTLDPAGRRDAAVVVAGLGLGEGVVADGVETDTLVVDRVSGRLDADVRPKTRRVVRGAAGGTAVAAVPAAQRDAPALDAGRARALVALGLRIEALFGAPQDVEWAVDAGGALHVTQARPITALPPGERCILDNSNVVESYPGVTSPLTFSFAIGLYETIFRSALRRMGVPAETLARNAHVFRNLIGTLDGRVYYVLTSWYPMLRLLPAADWLVPAWEEAVGLAERTGAEAQARRRNARTLRQGAAIAARMLREWLLLDRTMRAQRRRFEARMRAFASHDLARMDDHALARLYEELASGILEGWEITILNDFLAIGFTSWSKRLLAGLEPEGDALWNDLLCGEPGMASVEPVRSLVRLAEALRARPALARRLRALASGGAPVDASLSALGDDADAAGFRRAFETHVERFGDRCFEELKLESRTFRTHPRGLLDLLLRHAETDVTVASMEVRERAIRSEAEARVARALRGRPAARALLRFVLAQARRSIMHREASRLDRARAFAIPRAIFRQIGRNLADDGVLREADDVFALTVSEVLGFVRGASLDPDLAAIAARRHALAAEHRKRRPPPRVVCRGSVYRASVSTSGAGGALPAAGSGSEVETGDGGLRLRGVPCAPGVVTGDAVVVGDPARAGDVRGRILVAEMTDPGWVFLMTAAAGLVVEKGSILSHTAIIGRELGIPTVVGVAGATQRIRPGARIRLDGAAGTVTELTGDRRPET